MATPPSPLVYSALAVTIVTFAVAFASGCDQYTLKAEVQAGSCEGDAYGKDMDTGGAEIETTFGATADGDDIVIEIDDLDANCCPSPGADITTSGFDIQVDFQDVTADEACGCMCVMDFEIRIPDVLPGDYTIDLDYNGTFVASLEVTVP
jgi:type 1 fimbria pilin